MPRQSPFPSFSSPARNDLCSSSVQGTPMKKNDLSSKWRLKYLNYSIKHYQVCISCLSSQAECNFSWQYIIRTGLNFMTTVVLQESCYYYFKEKECSARFELQFLMRKRRNEEENRMTHPFSSPVFFHQGRQRDIHWKSSHWPHQLSQEKMLMRREKRKKKQGKCKRDSPC